MIDGGLVRRSSVDGSEERIWKPSLRIRLPPPYFVLAPVALSFYSTAEEGDSAGQKAFSSISYLSTLCRHQIF